MKKSTLITAAIISLTTTAFAEDVDLLCRQKTLKDDGSSVTYMLLNSLATQQYSLVKEESGYNENTGKATRTINFLEKPMRCIIGTDHGFQCEQIRSPDADPHDTFNKYNLSKSAGENSYVLNHYSIYQEYRTGRWIEKNEKLAEDLFCKS